MKIPYQEIRELYRKRLPFILKCQGKWYEPYSDEIDFLKFFSPIEDYIWQDIRAFGSLSLYPQFPVDVYWADFANPYFKIIIECDGKEFHKDKEKDRARDSRLRELGWKVFRISGADCNRYISLDLEDHTGDYNDPSDILKLFYQSTAGGLIRSLSIYCKRYEGTLQEYLLAEICLNARCTNSKIVMPRFVEYEYREFDNE